MKTISPILIIIPHGGQLIPDELSGYEQIDRFGLFIESDVCANELFSFEDDCAKKINTQISRIFVDLDRAPLKVPPAAADGVMKKETSNERKIFKDDIFPDEIAISNILKRYYLPFHKRIEKIMATGEIKFILECHTMMPVGPRNSFDAGKPRPLINVGNIANKDGATMSTCPDELAEAFIANLNKYFSDEDSTVAGKVSYNKPKFDGHILNKYGPGDIPMIRLSISRSLFLNDEYFSYDYLKVDELRINELKKKIWAGIERFITKSFEG